MVFRIKVVPTADQWTGDNLVPVPVLKDAAEDEAFFADPDTACRAMGIVLAGQRGDVTDDVARFVLVDTARRPATLSRFRAHCAKRRDEYRAFRDRARALAALGGTIELCEHCSKFFCIPPGVQRCSRCKQCAGRRADERTRNFGRNPTACEFLVSKSMPPILWQWREPPQGYDAKAAIGT